MVEIRGTKARLLPAVFLSALIAAGFPGTAQTRDGFRTVYTFCQQHKCSDGAMAWGLLPDGSGNLFGFTEDGGLHRGRGTIYELVHGKRYKLIHSFCEHDDCSDGISPNSLLIDVAGNLYGTTFQGGSSQTGTVFELSRAHGSDSWTYSQLYDFCSLDRCADGANPTGLTYAGAANGAAYDGVSPLFGTTDFSYGTANGGVAFQLSPAPGHPATWSQTVLYTFCAQANCADGRMPAGPLLMDASGNLFGTTSFGGTGDDGTVFELSPTGGGWTETTLYRFCSSTNCADGKLPSGGLIADSQGALYGTTQQGGGACGSTMGGTCGVLFKLVPAGVSSVETVLHAFCAKPDCRDGAYPVPGLIMDSSGNLFGATQYGGGNDGDTHGFGGGTAFELSGPKLRVMHSFCALADCADGQYPVYPLVTGAPGVLYGTTSGGDYRIGTVFKLEP